MLMSWQIFHWWRAVLGCVHLHWRAHLLYWAGIRAGSSLYERKHLGLQGVLRQWVLGLLHHWLQGTSHQRLWVTWQKYMLFLGMFLSIFLIIFEQSPIVGILRWWQGLCAVVGPLRWHQWPKRWLHVGLQREVLATQKGLSLLEWTRLSGHQTTEPMPVHPRWLPVVRQMIEQMPSDNVKLIFGHWQQLLCIMANIDLWGKPKISHTSISIDCFKMLFLTVGLMGILKMVTWAQHETFNCLNVKPVWSFKHNWTSKSAAELFQ